MVQVKDFIISLYEGFKKKPTLKTYQRYLRLKYKIKIDLTSLKNRIKNGFENQ